jgi:hypothetical protein
MSIKFLLSLALLAGLALTLSVRTLNGDGAVTARAADKTAQHIVLAQYNPRRCSYGSC